MIGTYIRIEERVSGWMRRWGPPLLRVSLGVIFVWFGLPKVLGLSPVNDLVGDVVPWIPPEIFVPALGALQVIVGVGFLLRPLLRVALMVFFVHMPGTMLPLILLPEVCFTQFPLAPTIEGQYVLKNLVLVTAGMVVAGTLHRGKTGEKRRLANPSPAGEGRPAL